MTESGYIIALDQGTTGTTAVLVDGSGRPVWSVNQEIEQIYPQPGWVEHDPSELFESCIEVAAELLDETEVHPRAVKAIGITNQRETALVWDRATGEPVMNAIVWQCRRTAPICESLISRGLGPSVRKKTGLPIDPYFSGTKFQWILDAIPNGQARAEAGELACGTVDSWLVWQLTNGTVHITDATNASRTMLFNIHTFDWDDDLLEALAIPRAMLPEVLSSSEVYGYASGHLFAGQGIPIAGIAGDQQASLFGQACFQPGMAKNTYGTGSFVLMNTGDQPVNSEHGLLSTVAWKIGDDVTYALEGSIFSTGATVQWLRDGLGVIGASSEVEDLASSVPDNGGVYIVPAFAGLGAPHWDMHARGSIVGLTRGSTKAHIARAALESTAYQTRDIVEAMESDTGLNISTLRVDGGATVNKLMMQFQSDMLSIPIEPSESQETTALGSAYLAGLAVGFWKDQAEIANLWRSGAKYVPMMEEESRVALQQSWSRAVTRSLDWASNEE
ncbi:MAG: glycerol kinase GlpK [SAR202 cluster bacterium]|jgi:glycerol kinase|nr:glycerol kinase GlpK [SAR202 cluster bacterium]